jgi:aspartate carbamoyltransferase catalytic subunit
MKHLLSTRDLSTEEICSILAMADHMAEINSRAVPKVPALRGRTIASVFFEDSTRTRLSFETAASRLSAEVMTFTASSSSVNKGESLRDTIETLSAMGVDAFVIRHKSSGAPQQITKWTDAAVINAGDGAHEHPTQALLDAFSIRRKFGTLEGVKVAIVGDILHSRVALSNIYALQLQGAEVKVCGPKTLIPKFIESLGVSVEPNLRKALEWCDAANMLRVQNERMDVNYFPSTREYTMQYGVDKALLDSLNKDIVIMHPGPINRGVEITSDVADSQQSVILDQVENGVAIRMAVIYLLASKLQK